MRLFEAGFDFAQSSVVALLATGDFVPERLTRWYEDTWDAPMISRYGLTELFGGANPCSLCSFYHLDPLAIGEAIDPKDKDPVSEGYGELAITCLYPFVQKQPFIRYCTGDLVEIGPTDCPTDPFGFKPVGRTTASCLPTHPETRGAAPWLAGNLIYEVVDKFPEVATTEIRLNLYGVVRPVFDHSALGPLRLRVLQKQDNGVDALTVIVETRFAHYMYPEASAVLRRAIRSALLERHPTSKDAVENKRLTLSVECALPGTLESFLPDEVE
jgi:hypothetical protein